MTHVAATSRTAELRAFSRAWWALWHFRVTHGEAVEPMVRAARTGQPWRVPASATVSDIGMVAIAVASPEFDAWRQHFERLGIRMPRPQRAAVIFAPSIEPPQRRAA